MQNTRNPLIFVVIESTIYNNLIVGFLKSKKYREIMAFNSPKECIKNLHLKPDIIVSNYAMEGLNGLEVMKTAKHEDPEVDFIFLSGQNDVDIAVNLIKRGAFDYIVKNDKALTRLAKSIENAINTTKSIKIRKGFKIGVIGFFIILLIIILIILSLTVFFPDDFSITF